jgi:pimeloyl-ACP methyl ester carboxylesterase
MSREDQAAPAAAMTYVLVHGGFHGGWCWHEVARRLRGLGHRVHTPTMTGLGERSHLMSPQVTLATFIEDLLQTFRFEDLTDAILVGHSFGGSLVSSLADRIPERLRHLVYLDAMVLRDGQTPADASPPGHIGRYAERSVDNGSGRVIPAIDAEAFGITDPEQRAWVNARLTPQPLQPFLDPLRLAHPLGNGLPVTYIACTDPLWGSTASSRAVARSMPDWSYLELATAHDAMLLVPDELTAILASL